MGHYKKEKNWTKKHVARIQMPQAQDSSNSNGPQTVSEEEPEAVKVTDVSLFKHLESRNLLGAVVFFGPGAEVLSIEFPSDYSAVQISCFRLDFNSENIQTILNILGETVPQSSIQIEPLSKAVPVVANVVINDPHFARRLKSTVHMGLRFYPVPKISIKILRVENGPEVSSTMLHMHSRSDSVGEEVAVKPLAGVGIGENQGESQTGKKLNPDCVVCQTEAENQYQTSCGHWYCRACFEGQCRNVNADDIPVLCLGDSGKCARAFEVLELRTALQNAAFERLLSKSFELYVRTNHKTFRTCPTSDCQKLLYRTSTDGAVITCPACFARICTTCHAPSHSGVTCAANQRAGTDEFASWKIWKDVRGCPRCGVPIEKDLWCRNMECTICEADFCWTCMEVVDTDFQCRCARESRVVVVQQRNENAALDDDNRLRDVRDDEGGMDVVGLPVFGADGIGSWVPRTPWDIGDGGGEQGSARHIENVGWE
ncbi:MAG: hypothetical protein ASARMPREDX12_007551 [Alectoria sarmentosa]|nr:MAG: hypothetical protein ASARMPREDX12_007551 [Alectoria sarmentosa]